MIKNKSRQDSMMHTQPINKKALKSIESKAFTKKLIIMKTTLFNLSSALMSNVLLKVTIFWTLATLKKVLIKSINLPHKINIHLPKVHITSEALRPCHKKMAWMWLLFKKGSSSLRKDSPSKGKKVKERLKHKMISFSTTITNLTSINWTIS